MGKLIFIGVLNFMLEKSRISGLVLVGGESKRMGKNKSLIDYQGYPQWEIAASILSTVCNVVYISTKAGDKKNYGKYIKIIDVFSEKIGPLNGIISAFRFKPNSAFIVLACDLPLFNKKALDFLLSYRDVSKIATTMYIDNKNKPEPLSTIYEPQAFSVLLKYWIKKEYCLRKIIRKENVCSVKSKNKLWVVNANYKEEYKKIKNYITKKFNKELGKEITIVYYAIMREIRGVSSEVFTSKSDTVSQLYDELKKIYRFPFTKQNLKVAIGSSFVNWSYKVYNKDKITFVPPVAGG